jgi:hypothetical protein
MAEDGAKRSREARGERNKESFCNPPYLPFSLSLSLVSASFMRCYLSTAGSNRLTVRPIPLPCFRPCSTACRK